MDNRAIEHCEQLAEKRLLQAIAWSHVLPYAELKTRAAINVDDATFQRVLNELITHGRWYREATAYPEAVLHPGGRTLPVHIEPVGDEATIARVSDALLRRTGAAF